MSICCGDKDKVSRILFGSLDTSGRRRVRVGEDVVPTQVLVWIVWVVSS